MDEDRKSTALKAPQGMIWRSGYLNGDFTGHLYPDVLPALKKWHQQGISLYVYSSGSVAAQKLLFGYSDRGDITALFSGYFDTHIGAKREVSAYQNIARQIALPASALLFLSDIRQELDAAQQAGWHTLQLIRGETETSESVWHSSDPEAIREQLNACSVRFERWEANRELGDNPAAETVINAYQHAIDRLVAEKGYQSWDVISMRVDNPQKEALRTKFLAEHTHGEDELRFFVEGSGLFCLHLADRVYPILCEKNDLISVPGGTPHWFDMGSNPHFTAIRIFDNPEGWIANFTGDPIAVNYPRLP